MSLTKDEARELARLLGKYAEGEGDEPYGEALPYAPGSAFPKDVREALYIRQHVGTDGDTHSATKHPYVALNSRITERTKLFWRYQLPPSVAHDEGRAAQSEYLLSIAELLASPGKVCLSFKTAEEAACTALIIEAARGGLEGAKHYLRSVARRQQSIDKLYPGMPRFPEEA